MTDEQKGSLNAKIMGGLVAAGLIVAVVFFVKSNRKKSVDSLGDLNTAKTKAGRIRQRKAVFAKLADEGKIYRKNRAGRRTKKATKK